MIYSLKSDYHEYSHFLENYENIDDIFIKKHLFWTKATQQKAIILDLYASQTGKKNYKFDISTFTLGFSVISQKTLDSLSDILLSSGTILDVETSSKIKKFYGFYANKNTYDNSILDFQKTRYREAENGKIFEHITFNSSAPINDYIFTLKEHSMTTFVTDKFRQAVEDAGLVGFDFSKKYEVSR